MATTTATGQEALDEQALDETFAALANSTRRRILARLADGAASVNESPNRSTSRSPRSPSTSRCSSGPG
jgi:DNA-binding transcriptional ArsR family regulator